MEQLGVKWSTNEVLLQSYRATFLSSESFLIGAGAILYPSSSTTFGFILLLILAAIALSILWCIWLPVVRSRAKIVDYFKHAYDLTPDQFSKLQSTCKVDAYVQDPVLHDQVNAEFFSIHSHWRATRKKLDLALPILLSVAWLFLILFATLNFFTQEHSSARTNASINVPGQFQPAIPPLAPTLPSNSTNPDKK